jgi:CubicO group peptidase (beta-lactamase class C family)
MMSRSTSPFVRSLASCGIVAAILAVRLPAMAQQPAEGASTNDPRRAQVSQVIEAALVRHKVPGASIAIIENYRILWAGGFGRRVATQSDAVASDTLFQAASISKPVTAVAVLKLVERGKLDLDENVNKRLKSWQVPDSPLMRDRSVTLRRLLSHTAGLTVHGFAGYAEGVPVPTLVRVLNGSPPANSKPIVLDVKPGYMFRYSGGGYCVTQQLLLDTIGLPFPDFMQQEVIEPLGMTHSSFQYPLPSGLIEKAAFGHRKDMVVLPGNYHVYPEMAAAGLWTTPSDLALVAIDLAKSFSSGQGRLVSQSTATEMLKVEKGQYGLGLSLNGQGAALNFGHGGGNEGYRCQLVAFPATGQGLVIMTNSDSGGDMFAEVITTAGKAYGWPNRK